MYCTYQLKKRKRKEKEKTVKERWKKNRTQTARNILQRDELSSVLTPGTTGLENCLLDMRRRMKTILGWYSSLVVLLSIER
jgi:hypothetical protein